jgi:hypothetical protein
MTARRVCSPCSRHTADLALDLVLVRETPACPSLWRGPCRLVVGLAPHRARGTVLRSPPTFPRRGWASIPFGRSRHPPPAASRRLLPSGAVVAIEGSHPDG